MTQHHQTDQYESLLYNIFDLRRIEMIKSTVHIQISTTCSTFNRLIGSIPQHAQFYARFIPCKET